MAKQLTDRRRKQIIADYVECGNYSEVARKHKVHASTVRRAVTGDDETHEKAQQKKEQNTRDMLDFMDSRKEKAQLFIDACLDEMLTPGRLGAAKLSEITTAMGTVVDKFTKNGKAQTDHAHVAEGLANLAEALKATAPDRTLPKGATEE